jgi:MFS family permease
MALLNNNIVNVAPPKITANLGSTVDQIEWVVTGYMIAFGLSMPATSWLRKVFGFRAPMFLSVIVEPRIYLGQTLDGFVKSLSAALRFTFVVAAYRQVRFLLRFCAPCIWSFLHCHPVSDFLQDHQPLGHR